jgi:hypothetical protein
MGCGQGPREVTAHQRKSSGRIHLLYRRTGGVAGIAMEAHADEMDLPASQQALIGTILAASSETLVDEGSEPTGPVGQPDRFAYELRLDDGSQRRTLRWYEPDVPSEVKPLLDELGRRAHLARSDDWQADGASRP